EGAAGVGQGPRRPGTHASGETHPRPGRRVQPRPAGVGFPPRRLPFTGFRMHLPQSSTPGPDVAEVRSQISPGHRVRLLSGVLSYLLPTLAWVGTFAGIVLLPWWAKLPLGLLNGILIGVLFIVGHDACHGILTPHRWLNRLLGRLCLLPS